MMSVPGAGAVLRRHGAHEEHAVGADAGVRRVLADHGAVVRLRLQPRVHRGQRVLRRPRPAVPEGHVRLGQGRVRDGGDVLARTRRSPSSCSSRSRRRSPRSPCASILGAFAERIKFSAVLLFAVLWFTFSYLPIAHMVWFWPGPDAYTAANVVDAHERQGRPDLAVGRARLRGRHGRAHQRRHRGPRGRLRARQAHRLRQGSDGAAQPADDDDRRLAAVVRLVRLQRRLGARSEQLRRRSRSSTRSSRRPARCCRGRSANGCSRASRRCSVPRRVRSRDSSRSRRPPATSASRARS